MILSTLFQPVLIYELSTMKNMRHNLIAKNEISLVEAIFYFY